MCAAAPKPAPKPAVAAPKELAPRPVKRAQETVQAVLKEAPKVADKVKPPSLPTTPPPPPVTAEKPKVGKLAHRATSTPFGSETS